MVRSPSVDENGLTKGAWSEEEDRKLKAYVQRYGHWNWRQLPRFAGLARCGKSCRLRWMNYLKPGVRRGNYTPQEEDLILKLNKEFGNRWSFIASRLPGRTDNEIKNYWHTHLRRRAKQERKSTRAAGEISVIGHHQKYEESSSLSTFDSTDQEMNDRVLETNSININNFGAQVDDQHVYSEVSSLYYDPSPTLFQEFGTSVSGLNLSSWEQVMQPFGESTLLPQEELQLPPLVEDEIILPLSPYIDENDITWLHDLLQQ